MTAVSWLLHVHTVRGTFLILLVFHYVDSQLGLLGAITPAVTFIVSPLWGALADATGTKPSATEHALILLLLLLLPLHLSFSISLSFSLADFYFTLGKHKQIMLLTFIGSVIARCALITCKQHMTMLSIVVAIAAALYAPVKPLLDSAVMSMLTDKTAYGKSRLFGQVGFGLGSYLVGPLLHTHLRAIFAIQVILSIPTCVMMAIFTPHPPAPALELKKVGDKLSRWLSTSSDVKPPPDTTLHVLSTLRNALSQVDVLVFFLVVFIIGISSGIVENFAYIRLTEVATLSQTSEDCSGSGSSYGNVLGISRLVSSLAGGPMFWLSGKLVSILGINGVLTISLISYTLRFLIYASIHNPWHALPAEMLRGVTFAMFWSAATYYVYQIAPKGLTATMVSYTSILTVFDRLCVRVVQLTSCLLYGRLLQQHIRMINSWHLNTDTGLLTSGLRY
jgi:hypothetical protein